MWGWGGASLRPAMRVIAPGAMQLTRMPWSAPAAARLRVSPITPPLAVAYDVLLGRPKTPADVVLTMRPYPASAMCGHAARTVLNEPSTCTARWRRRLSASTSGMPAQRMMPALFTRASMRPNRSTVVDTSASAPSTVATSTRPSKRYSVTGPEPGRRRSGRRRGTEPQQLAERAADHGLALGVGDAGHL